MIMNSTTGALSEIFSSGRITPLGVPLPSGELFLERYRKKPLVSLPTIIITSGHFVISTLVGFIVYACWSQYHKVKEELHKLKELKKQAEAANVAKSQLAVYVRDDVRSLVM